MLSGGRKGDALFGAAGAGLQFCSGGGAGGGLKHCAFIPAVGGSLLLAAERTGAAVLVSGLRKDTVAVGAGILNTGHAIT